MDAVKIIESYCNGGLEALFRGLDWKAAGGIDATCMSSGLTPIFHCIKMGRLDLVRVLINLGADVQKKCEEYQHEFGCFVDISALAFAALLGQTDILKGLHEEFKLGNLQEAIGFVAISGSTASLEYLLSKGVDPNLDVEDLGGGDLNSSKIINIAAQFCHCEFVKKLVDCGVDINGKDSIGETPLTVLSDVNDPDKRHSMYQLLHSLGADFQIKHVYFPHYLTHKRTILHEVIWVSRVEDIKPLVELCPALLELPDNHGKRPVHYASDKGDVKSLEILQSLSANMNVTDNDRNTPLDIALMNNDSVAITFLRSITDHILFIPRKFYNASYAPMRLGKLVIELPEKISMPELKLSEIGSMVKLRIPYKEAILSLALSIKTAPRLEIHAALSLKSEFLNYHSLVTNPNYLWVQRHTEGCRIEMNHGKETLMKYLVNQAGGANSGAKFVSMDAKRDDGKEIYCNTVVKDLFKHCEGQLEKKFAVGDFNDGSKETNCTWFAIEFLKKHGFTIEQSSMKQCIKSIIGNDSCTDEIVEQFRALWKRDCSVLAQAAPKIFKKRKESQRASNDENAIRNPIRMRETMGL